MTDPIEEGLLVSQSGNTAAYTIYENESEARIGISMNWSRRPTPDDILDFEDFIKRELQEEYGLEVANITSHMGTQDPDVSRNFINKYLETGIIPESEREDN